MSEQLHIEDIKKVLILGAGTLGLRVGLRAALSGYDVNIYDTNQEQLNTSRKVQLKLGKSISAELGMSEEAFEQVVNQITFTTDPAKAADGVDFVNESVTEDIEIKSSVWKKFGELCPRHAVLTTNTSFLLPSQFSDLSGRPERFCAFHFHDVFVANVVDIMPHPSTASWIPDLLFELGKKLHQTPIRVAKESSGYVFNHILMNSLQAAVALLDKGISTVEDIDRSWMGNFNMPVGPFGMLDQIGLDTAWRIAQSQESKESKRFAAVLKNYIDQHALGVKTGKGFYTYPNPNYQDGQFL